MKIGRFDLPNRVFAAPMAGIADRPFRQLCRELGAGYAVGEMTTADPRLRASRKTSRRLCTDGEQGPIAVQLAGADPLVLADAARHAVDSGAQIIDINMGCPAKKVCNAACGSALLRDEALVARIIESVVSAVAVPVTLKLRTGWSPQLRNAVRICHMAESGGIQMLALHGRTRACGFRGNAEYDTIAEVKTRVRIPVIANGDIDTPEKAQYVLTHTGADAVMIGRAAQMRPWIFREIDHFLRNGTKKPPITIAEARPLLLRYLDAHYSHHGELIGARSARKRIHFLARGLLGGARLCERVNQTEDCANQRRALDEFLLESAARHPFFEYIDAAESLDVEQASRTYLHDRALSEKQKFPSQLRPH
ncbi:tRNA-dihydrouridine synthase B [Burkholderiales bacterium]|nr:tRNA-dihydrouridine synthase B [Burkholderiales bacterium]